MSLGKTWSVGNYQIRQQIALMFESEAGIIWEDIALTAFCLWGLYSINLNFKKEINVQSLDVKVMISLASF